MGLVLVPDRSEKPHELSLSLPRNNMFHIQTCKMLPWDSLLESPNMRNFKRQITLHKVWESLSYNPLPIYAMAPILYLSKLC